MGLNDIKLRILEWSGLTTKGANLTPSEVDQNFIELYEAAKTQTTTV